jgi:hypothetical protein
MLKALGMLVLLLMPFTSAFADNDSGGIGAFLATVKNARLIDLSHTWEITSPIASVNPPYSFALKSTHENTRGTFGDAGQLSRWFRAAIKA